MHQYTGKPLAVTLPHSGLTLHGYRAGTPAGHPALCLHGWLDNANSFSALIPRLAETEALDLVALDLPGHGHSPPLPGATCHYLDYAATVLDILAALDWPSAHVLGHSLGGALATLVAGTHPNRIDRLVLLDALGPLAAEPDDTVARTRRYLTHYLHTPNHRVYPTRTSAITIRTHLADLTWQAAATLTDRGLAPTRGGYTWRHDPRLTHGLIPAFTEDQVHAYLRAITAPTLLLTADRTALHESCYPARRAAVSTLTHTTLPGGHHFHLTHPGPVAAATSAFLTHTPTYDANPAPAQF